MVLVLPRMWTQGSSDTCPSYKQLQAAVDTFNLSLKWPDVAPTCLVFREELCSGVDEARATS